jgi:hypothetical protein
MQMSFRFSSLSLREANANHPSSNPDCTVLNDGNNPKSNFPGIKKSANKAINRSARKAAS